MESLNQDKFEELISSLQMHVIGVSSEVKEKRKKKNTTNKCHIYLKLKKKTKCFGRFI